MRNVYDQNVAELAYCIIVFYTQELGTWLGDILSGPKKKRTQS